MRKRRRTWVKLSGPYRLGSYADSRAREFARQAGPDSLVRASGCPFIGKEKNIACQATDWVAACVPDR